MLLLLLLLLLSLSLMLLLLLLLLLCRLLMVIVIVIMMMTLPYPYNVPTLLVKISFLSYLRKFDLYSLQLVLQAPIGRFQVMTLLKTFATTILSVSSVLKGPSLLF